MESGLYHSSVYFPFDYSFLPRKVKDIIYCPHALNMARERNILLPKNTYAHEIPEVEIQDNQIVKALYRCHYNKYQDICLIFHIIDNKPYMVRTVWLNYIRNPISVNRDKYVHDNR